MEITARRKPLIQTVRLSGFKDPAHTHCVLLFICRPHPPPRGPQGDWPPCVVEQGTRCLHAGLPGPCVGLVPPGPRHTTLKTRGSKESQSAKYVSQTFRKQREYCKEPWNRCLLKILRRKKNQLSKSLPATHGTTDLPRRTTSSSSSSPLPSFFPEFWNDKTINTWS